MMNKKIFVAFFSSFSGGCMVHLSGDNLNSVKYPKLRIEGSSITPSTAVSFDHLLTMYLSSKLLLEAFNINEKQAQRQTAAGRFRPKDMG